MSDEQNGRFALAGCEEAMEEHTRKALAAQPRDDVPPELDAIIHGSMDKDFERKAALAPTTQGTEAVRYIRDTLYAVTGLAIAPSVPMRQQINAAHRKLAALATQPRDDVRELTRSEVKALWVEHGGSQHGPMVEHYTIEEQAFYRFVKALQERVTALAPTTQGTDSGLAGELENIVINLVGTFKAHCENADEFLEPDDQANFDHWEAEAFRILTALRTDRKAVLEEAAKVADAEYERTITSQSSYGSGRAAAAEEIAQAIRALAEGAGK